MSENNDCRLEGEDEDLKRILDLWDHVGLGVKEIADLTTLEYETVVTVLSQAGRLKPKRPNH